LILKKILKWHKNCFIYKLKGGDRKGKDNFWLIGVWEIKGIKEEKRRIRWERG
jgi:hypothetical protein